jgi:hypothetical protein
MASFGYSPTRLPLFYFHLPVLGLRMSGGPMGKRLALLVASVVMLPGASLFASLAPQAASASNPGDLGGDLGAAATSCKDLPLVRVMSVSADGSEQVPVANDGLGRRYYYQMDGSEVTQVTPPPGWSPLSATDTELRAYGLHPQPKDPVALQQWKQKYANWHGSGPVGMCQTQFSALGVFSSGNWAGGMASSYNTPGTYWDATLGFYQPSFVAVCPSASAYAIWSGLDGWDYNNYLLQTGTEAQQSGLNTIKAWWEGIKPGYDSHITNFSGSSIPTGHFIYTDTDYYNGTVAFDVYDSTAGVDWNTGFMGTIGGHAVSGFYKGTTADFITEQPSINGSQVRLRKPTSGSTYMYYAEANIEPIANFPASRVNEDSGSVQSSGYDGVHAWYDTWHSCN